MQGTEQPSGPSPRAGWSERIRALTLDLGPLRSSRDFKALWIGNSISAIGSRLTFVCIPFQVFHLTGSTLAVGLLGLCELVPILSLSLVGGAIADAVDRRKLLLVTETAMALCSGGLAVNAVQDRPQLWAIYLFTAAIAALYALGAPAFRSTAPLLLEKDELPAASALDGVSLNLSAVIGPALAGLFIATVGLGTTYVIDVVTFGASLVAVASIAPLPPREGAEPPGLRSVLQGVRFLKGRPVLQGSFVVDLIAMVFGMPNALFPAIAASLGGPGTVGLLYAAPSAGALLASLTSGWVGKIGRQGLAVYLAVAIWGMALALFGLTDSLWLALLLLAVAGGADLVSAVFRNTILQTRTPSDMIGRLSGLELTVVASGPALGDLEAGALAAVTSVRFSVVAGGIGCLVGIAVMAVAMPAFGRYDASSDKVASHTQ